MNTPDIEVEDERNNNNNNKGSISFNSRLRNMDLNGLISGIMYRMRKASNNCC